MAETVTWIDPSSTSYALDGSSYYTGIVGRSGLFAPPTQVIEQEVPLQPGARLRQIKTVTRPPVVPVLIRASSEAQFAVARRALRWAMNPNRGAGTLRIKASDNTQRDLVCYCESGFEGDESDTYRGPGFAILPLGFKALDPYWYDSSATVVTLTPGGTTQFFRTPFFPLQLSSSGISNSFTVNNTGDVQCWPVWVITGPGSNPVLTNNTTGKTITMAVTLTAGQTVTIDTRPGYKTVTREDGTLHYSYLSFASSLWPLVTGANGISLSMSGTTSASALQLQYKQAYDGY